MTAPKAAGAVPSGARFVTASEVGRRYGWSRATLSRKRAAGLVPQPVMIGGSLRWAVDDLEKFEARAMRDRAAL